MSLTNKNMIKEKAHPSSYIGGVQRFYRFKSGYGLSVVNGTMLHSYPFAWEIAITKYTGKGYDDFNLDYDTKMSSDVEVFMSDEEANTFINRAIKEIG